MYLDENEYLKELDYLRSERLEELNQLFEKEGNTPLLNEAEELINAGYNKGE